MDQRMEASLENKLIGDILREHPQMDRTIERYFWRHCLESTGFRILTLGMACILFGVDRKRMFKELEDYQNEWACIKS